MTRNILFILYDLLLFPTMKELSKSVNSWWSYRKKFDRTFFSETQCSLIVCRRRQSFEDESKLVTAERPFW